MGAQVEWLDELRDTDTEAEPVAGATTVLALDAGVWKRATVAGFDPDTPLDYLTMTDQTTGETVVATIDNGAWTFTTVDRRITEGGDTRVTEDGSPRITE